jgi:hypothetical protein
MIKPIQKSDIVLADELIMFSPEFENESVALLHPVIDSPRIELPFLDPVHQ